MLVIVSFPYSGGKDAAFTMLPGTSR